jgi:solute carrier family 25 (mitochondrial S-adenosylmethionine transporter), member 26
MPHTGRYSCSPSACGRRPSSQRAPSVLFTVASSSNVGFKPELNPVRTFQLGMLAGAVAGFTVDAVLFPLDTLKTRLQMSANAAARGALFRGLYDGFAPAVVASAPAAAAFFGTYDYVKRVLAAVSKDDDGRWAPLQHMVAAAAGDVAGSTIRVPFEVVKQRLQSGLNKSTAEAVRTVLAKEGVAGFFTGYSSLIIRELPFDAIQFPLYEFLKTQWAKRSRTGKLETWQQSLCGSAAGGFAAAVTTPLDVVKTRLMTQGAAAGGIGGSSVPYSGIVNGLTRIAREEGTAVLFSGIVPRVVWISVGGAFFFGSYEAARKALLPKFSDLSENDKMTEKSAQAKR